MNVTGRTWTLIAAGGLVLGDAGAAATAGWLEAILASVATAAAANG